MAKLQAKHQDFIFEHFKDGGKLAGFYDSKIIFFIQTLRLKIHEQQSSTKTIFFPNIKITGTKNVLIVS